MKAARSLARAVRLAALLALVAMQTAQAGLSPTLPPLGSTPSELRAERVQLVCGPYRCIRRPFWRYGPGVGFRPFRPFGVAPVPRFGYRPFGFGRFGRRFR